MDAILKHSCLPERDDVDAFVALVDLAILVRDLLVQHKGLSFSGPEDKPLKPLEIVLVDDASHNLKVAVKARLLNRR